MHQAQSSQTKQAKPKKANQAGKPCNAIKQISKQANKLASNEANKQANKLTTCANSADYDSPRILVVRKEGRKEGREHFKVLQTT